MDHLHPYHHNHYDHNDQEDYKQQLINDELERISAIEAALATACEARDSYAVLLERAESSKITDFSAIIRAEEELEQEMMMGGGGEDNNHNNYDDSSRAAPEGIVTTREKERNLILKWRAEYKES